MLVLAVVLSLGRLVCANTEAYGFQIPNYYDVPGHAPGGPASTAIVPLNHTARLLTDHPILSVSNYSTAELVLTVPYDFSGLPKQTLFVRLNNYHNCSFEPNDLIHVKLCWPATTPVNFNLSHRFIQEREFGAEASPRDTLHIYLVIDYQADFYPVEPMHHTSFDMLLAVSKLPNTVPIPIELYGVIVYVVDLMILTATALPWILQQFSSYIELMQC
ncbi:hypothetical protein METBIDRAFT_188240 [Metschnikowia bicuspidata var. bicuspidata NRRL YB-4993]|uniref:Uncharacterized protein n=1 Tax=Metschnikowia bicuspidata var. bicuspidata NRRL YB-4993 TaxID=869754 RepID=A0A1A0HCG3_9ASCO|nr:hypothetical protein METBIDRAFT_188240 [Metschnikowia bicuspidata var. bicuspidata NRRL YB-4993]OBA21577.1 hypothetical protein METBIDRAFT_188240 [Metschnikowia bicuspidata var. bicuspidata NRRL YB-4993]